MATGTRAPSTIMTINLTGQTDFNIPFEYLARKFVVVTLLGIDRKVLTLNTDYRFVSKTVISLANPTPAGYSQLELRRKTSATERLVDFHDGSILRAYDLNLSQIQTLHVAEEARDSVNSDSISIDDEFNLDARGKRIVNLAYAQAGGDAVPLGQILEMDKNAFDSAQDAKAEADRSKYWADISMESATASWALASQYGVLTTNTAAQNTAAWEALTRLHRNILVPTGVYRFDVFRTGDRGINVVSLGDKTNTVFELEGTATVVAGQMNKANIQGIHFKSVMGSREWQRINILEDVRLFRCKVSDFLHNVPAPNAWGIYSKDSVGSVLEECEFDNNSQSDIAILEGTERLKIVRCFHTTGRLRINFEPNNNVKPIKHVKVEQCRIDLLELLNNDLAQNNDYVAVIENCVVNRLRYDGLGTDFINTSIGSFENADSLNGRQYMSRLSGVSAGEELLDDTAFNVVGLSSATPPPWNMRYSTASPNNRYARAEDGGIRVSINEASATTLQSRKFPITGDALLVTKTMRVERSGGRPDIFNLEFYAADGSTIGTYKMVRGLTDTAYATVSAIVLPPSNAVSATLNVMGGDTATASSFQTLVWKYVSVRPLKTGQVRCPVMADPIPKLDKHVYLPFTYTSFVTGNPYVCPLPAGTHVEFAYELDKPRLVEIITAAATADGRLGTLRVLAKYPATATTFEFKDIPQIRPVG